MAQNNTIEQPSEFELSKMQIFNNPNPGQIMPGYEKPFNDYWYITGWWWWYTGSLVKKDLIVKNIVITNVINTAVISNPKLTLYSATL